MVSLLTWRLLFMALVPLAYFCLMAIVRWHAVAVPTRRLAQAQIEGLRKRWKQEFASPGLQNAEEQALGEQIEELLEQAETALSDSFWEKLLWPRGAELQSWRFIHEAESLIALGMDEELAKEKLAQVRAEKAPPPAPAEQFCIHPGGKVEILAGLLKWTVQFSTQPPLKIEEISAKRENPPQNPSKGNKDVRKQLYWELRRYYDKKDTYFARLSTTHAKIAWLTYVGLALVGLFLVLGQRNLPELPFWMLFGALGAVLSRCLRFLLAPQLPTEYGVYWILLFLAPVYGALAGVAGVLLVHLLVEMKILSSDTFGSLLLNQTDQAAGMYGRFALAALTGLSERWLDRLVTQADEKGLPTSQKEKETGSEKSPEQSNKQDDHSHVVTPRST